jgi:hypothetical protein
MYGYQCDICLKIFFLVLITGTDLKGLIPGSDQDQVCGHEESEAKQEGEGGDTQGWTESQVSPQVLKLKSAFLWT